MSKDNHTWKKKVQINGSLVWIWKCSVCGMEATNLESEDRPSHVIVHDKWSDHFENINMSCEEYAIKDVIS